MTVKLLTEHHLEFLSFTGGCTGSSESILVKTPHCWKSHVMTHIPVIFTCLSCFFCFVCLLLYVPVNSYDHVGTVSSHYHICFLGKLEQAVKPELSLVTDNNSGDRRRMTAF